MNIRLLCIIGLLALLGLGGCVVADHDGQGYYGGYGYYDPWFYDGYGYHTVPGYFAPYPYDGHRHTYFYDRGGDRHRDQGWSGSRGGNSTGPTGIAGNPRGSHEGNWQKPVRSEHYEIHHDRGHDRDEGRHGHVARPPRLQCHGPRC